MLYKKTRRTWSDMKKRCDNPNHQHYKYYGGRGIGYCRRWKSFENFLEDMGEKPEERSLDKIDNDQNYSQKNCRWATRVEQSRNRSQNIIFKGECAKDASKRLGGGDNLVQKRVKRGWSMQEAFTIPPAVA